MGPTGLALRLTEIVKYGIHKHSMLYLMVLQKVVPEVLEEALQVFLLDTPLFQSCRQDILPVFDDTVCA